MVHSAGPDGTLPARNGETVTNSAHEDSVGARHLDRRLVCMALAHNAVVTDRLVTSWPQMKRFWYLFLFQLTGIYEMVVSAEECAFVERLWRDWSPGLAIDPGDMARIRAMLSRPEVLEAALGYYRQTLDATRQADELNDVQMAVTYDDLTVPAMFMGGVDDGCFGAEFMAESADHCTAGCRVEVLESCGHFLHQERPDEVNRLILDFIGPAAPVHTG